MSPESTAEIIKLLSKYDPAWLLIMVAVWIFVWRFNYILSAFSSAFENETSARRAEGETPAQHAFLAQEGCDEVQGYLTGRPLDIADYAGVVGQKLIAAARARAV
jgi:hypothetical protein